MKFYELINNYKAQFYKTSTTAQVYMFGPNQIWEYQESENRFVKVNEMHMLDLMQEMELATWEDLNQDTRSQGTRIEGKFPQIHGLKVTFPGYQGWQLPSEDGSII